MNKRRLITSVCSIMLLTLILSNIPTCVSFCKSTYNEFLKVVRVNSKQVILDKTKAVTIMIPKDMDEIEYKGIHYKSKVYQDFSKIEKELGIDLLQYPYSQNSSSIVLQIQDDSDVLIHVEPETITDKNPEIIFMEFSIAASKNDKKLIFNDQKAHSFTDKNGNIILEQLGNKYDIVDTYKSDKFGSAVTIVKDTSISNKDSKSEHVQDISYNAIFVYNNIEYRVCLSGTKQDIIKCIEKLC